MALSINILNQKILKEQCNMLTKEEMLQKGISEEEADQILSAFEPGSEEDPLQALNKAISGDSEEDLFTSLNKADDGEGEEEEGKEGYDEEYMKKYMKRYMKSNGKACTKMMKEVGLIQDDMKKAIDDIDIDADGAVVEMEDLKPFLDSQADFNASMVKAMNDLAGYIDVIVAQNDKSYDLMKKAASVTAIQAEGMGHFLGKSQGRSGVVATQNLEKAGGLDISNVSEEQNKTIHSTLMKAVKAGDEKAGTIISVFESVGHDANKMNPAQKKALNDIMMNQEVK
jgi:hypothetical protein